MVAPRRPLVLEEVVLVGRHPTLDVEVVVLGSGGGDDVWAAACEYAEVAVSGARAGGAEVVGAVVWDLRNKQTRAAKGLRRIR